MYRKWSVGFWEVILHEMGIRKHRLGDERKEKVQLRCYRRVFVSWRRTLYGTARFTGAGGC